MLNFNSFNYLKIAGSEQPPKVEGRVRLYSMKFCPFAHRVRLALSFKKIPYEIVNINLKAKPEWYLNVCI